MKLWLAVSGIEVPFEKPRTAVCWAAVRLQNAGMVLPGAIEAQKAAAVGKLLMTWTCMGEVSAPNDSSLVRTLWSRLA